MSRMFVLGVDPGFASVGYAVVELFPSGEQVLETRVFRTAKSDAKLNTLAADDTVRRTREIAKDLEQMLERLMNCEGDRRLVAICAEAMSYPRNAVVAAKMAMTWGVLAANAERRNLALVQASPQQVKKAVCGTGSASKDEVATALVTRYREIPGIAELPRTLREHAYDALAAVVCCLGSEVVRMARALSG